MAHCGSVCSRAAIQSLIHQPLYDHRNGLTLTWMPQCGLWLMKEKVFMKQLRSMVCQGVHLVLPGDMSGPHSYLKRKELVNFLYRAAQIGHGQTCKEVIAIVQHVLDACGSNKVFFCRLVDFLIRWHPEMTLRTPTTLSIARASVSDRCALDNYFDELESTWVEKDLLNSPSVIFNMDETGMPLDLFPPKMSHGVSIGVSSGLKSVVSCVSASGQCLSLWLYGTVSLSLLSWQVDRCGWDHLWSVTEMIDRSRAIWYVVSPAFSLLYSSSSSTHPFVNERALITLLPCCHQVCSSGEGNSVLSPSKYHTPHSAIR